MLESLLVLACLSLILLLSQQPNYQGWQEDLISRQFFQSLISELKYCKERAVLENSRGLVSFNGLKQEVLFQYGSQGQVWLRMEIPENWHLGANYQLIYYGDGRANSFRTILFEHRYEDKQVELSFQLGSGIFDKLVYWEDKR